MFIFKYLLICFFSIFLCVSEINSAISQGSMNSSTVPNTLVYNSIAVDENDILISGEYDVDVSLLCNENDASPLWSHTYTNITFIKGEFELILFKNNNGDLLAEAFNKKCVNTN